MFFFKDTTTTEIYTLSLPNALPILRGRHWRGRPAPPLGRGHARRVQGLGRRGGAPARRARAQPGRSEEHTSELQSRQYLVCRVLLEKKKHIIHPSPDVYLQCVHHVL